MLRYHLLWLVSLAFPYPVYQWMRTSKVIGIPPNRYTGRTPASRCRFQPRRNLRS